MKNIFDKINKKHLVIISVIVILSFVLVGLYTTLAIYNDNNTSYIDTDKVFKLIVGDVSNNKYSTTISRNDTKDLDFIIENKEDINLKYLLYYSTLSNNEDINVYLLPNSKNKGEDIIGSKASYVVSVRIINNSKYDENINFGINYGYEKGGDINIEENQIKIDKVIDIDTNLDKSGANSPSINEDMIPIYYDNYNNVWKKADESNIDNSSLWYDYNNKKWANVVLKDSNIIVDISNNLNNGTNKGGSWNKDKGYISTNGGYIDCGFKNYYFGSKLSVVSKVKLHDNGTIISNVSNNKGLSIEYSKSNDKYNISANIYSTTSDKVSTITGNFDISDEYIIAVTFDGDKDKDNLNIYVNGNLIASGNVRGGILASDKNLSIGNNIDVSNIVVNSNELSKDDIDKYYSKDIMVNDYKNTILHYNFMDGIDIPNNTVIGDNEKYGSLYFLTWIPRYKYRVWNIDKIEKNFTYTTIDGEVYNPYNKGIDIVFENGNKSTGTINCSYKINNNSDFLYVSDDANNSTLSEECVGSNYEYYTHPAFLDKTGFWISKFEISGTEGNQLSLPNKKSLALNLNDAFNNSLNVVNDKFSSHLIKNMEWGAVSYLSHSIYGLCDGYSCSDVLVNNSSDYYTGRSSGTDINSEELEKNKFGNYTYFGNIIDKDGKVTTNIDSTKIATTTNNPYGVYDMAGGREELVMGIMSSVNGNINPLFNTILKDKDNSYYDIYSFGNESNSRYSYNRSRLGDAMGELVLSYDIENGLWYNHYNNFLSNNLEIITRGGDSSVINNTGLFSYNAVSLSSVNKYGYRIIIN